MFRLRISRSIFSYILIFILLILIYSMVFLYLMRTYENRDYEFITAIYWVVATITTEGYGDIVFDSSIGQLFSVIVILSGIVMIFALLSPLVVTPVLERTARRELPLKVRADLKNHIIICGYNQLIETLITELDEYRVPFVIIDENEKNITQLVFRKILCVHGDASDEDVLLNSNILSARMLIANQSDEKNASIVLTSRELGNVKVISLVEDTAKAGYLTYAGSDRVISPKALFGTYLGRKAIDPLTVHLSGATRFFADISIVEFPIYLRSVLIGKKLKDAQIRELTGANIVGLWSGGRLSLNPQPEDLIRENSVLLAVGTEKKLEALKKMTR
ncbi:K+ transport system, NAD-binding component [Candidatus Methanoperedens nitroreducens]|uniref:K+ transport system, NAD-binding component n=1 Tax=Candidatus Methanoperedens nitratireducens TaxID=1392998 RepID=A0A062V1H8_9EURY|nr:potassium channel protein [Candidatus Methanoperedens nitroreducens]KCZ70468.1 K+ transport system, NAD-binding component [Candidatus Methanoperedens nitroreducens]MDJ1420905.1 NAD-binding protein [Candidatus Methanoperedens sp.]